MLDAWDDRVLVGADSVEQASEDWRQRQRDDGDGDDGDRGPEQEGVPLP